MAHPETVAKMKIQFSNKSDEELIAIQIESVGTPDPKVLYEHIAATQLLHERQFAVEKSRHTELLAEIKRPHWSVTPAFLVGVVAAVASLVAAYYAYIAYSQPSQSAAITQQISKARAPSSKW